MERLSKILSQRGVCSRRQAEEKITQGLVFVEGACVTNLAQKFSPDVLVEVAGKKIAPRRPLRLWLYHKPCGLVVTHKDEKGRKTIFSQLDHLPRVLTVGRLDLNSEGLLILTNSGELSRALEKSSLPRVYHVRVFGIPDFQRLKEIQQGATIEGMTYRPATVSLPTREAGNQWLTVTIQEGKNREVRKMMTYASLQVNRLRRTAFGPFELGNLPLGKTKELPAADIKGLCKKYVAL